MPNSRVAIYAGSFDPITRGHEDLMHRSLEYVDQLVVAVATNSSKTPFFNVDERVALVRAEQTTQSCRLPNHRECSGNHDEQRNRDDDQAARRHQLARPNKPRSTSPIDSVLKSRNSPASKNTPPQIGHCS